MFEIPGNSRNKHGPSRLMLVLKAFLAGSFSEGLITMTYKVEMFRDLTCMMLTK